MPEVPRQAQPRCGAGGHGAANDAERRHIMRRRFAHRFQPRHLKGAASFPIVPHNIWDVLQQILFMRTPKALPFCSQVTSRYISYIAQFLFDLDTSSTPLLDVANADNRPSTESHACEAQRSYRR